MSAYLFFLFCGIISETTGLPAFTPKVYNLPTSNITSLGRHSTNTMLYTFRTYTATAVKCDPCPIKQNYIDSTNLSSVETTPQDNLRTMQCPNGETFSLACNHCTCNLETGVTLCTVSTCQGWRCSQSQHHCYGRCVCNHKTLITSCDKKNCTT